MEAILSDPELRVRLRPQAQGNRKHGQRETASRICDVIGVISESLEDPCSAPLDY